MATRPPVPSIQPGGGSSRCAIHAADVSESSSAPCYVGGGPATVSAARGRRLSRLSASCDVLADTTRLFGGDESNASLKSHCVRGLDDVFYCLLHGHLDWKCVCVGASGNYVRQQDIVTERNLFTGARVGQYKTQ